MTMNSIYVMHCLPFQTYSVLKDITAPMALAFIRYFCHGHRNSRIIL